VPQPCAEPFGRRAWCGVRGCRAGRFGGAPRLEWGRPAGSAVTGRGGFSGGHRVRSVDQR